MNINKTIFVVVRQEYSNGKQRGNFSDEYLDSIRKTFRNGFIVDGESYDHDSAKAAAIAEAVRLGSIETADANVEFIVVENKTHWSFAPDAEHDATWFKPMASEELVFGNSLVWQNGVSE